MSSSDSATLPIELLRQIDAICREYEKEWRDASLPKLEVYLQRIPDDAQYQLLRELLVIELNYRRNEQGERLTTQELCALHTDLSDEIVKCLNRLSVDEPDTTPRLYGQLSPSPSHGSLEPTLVHQRRTGSSRGLHIRCPHCSNPVELLGDTSFDSITCQTCGSAFSLINENEATQQAPVLKQIGRFEIVGRLGVGGFGTVWKARDPELERAVAIKIPRKGQLDRDEIEDFLKEARTTAQLHHRHIVPVYEVGKDGDAVFIVSELIRGVSLSDWLSGASPDFRQIAELLAPVAEALDHAHKKGVIHRDLKPSNILIDENGQPNVMDFGLAKRDGLEITMTVEGQVLGTPAYMSPEQAAGKSNWTDCRMDIYSFGVVLFRMLTGELPYRGNAQMQIHLRLTQDAPDPCSLNRYIPRDLATICLKCLERDPNGRYSTSKQVAEELERFLSGEPILARPISRVERTIRWARRKPALAVASILLVVLAVGGPTVAAIIEYQRHTLDALLTERNNLIERMGNERSSLLGDRSALQEQLDIWEGRANPWQIWPPKTSEPPQQNLLQVLLPNGKSLVEKWHASSDRVQQAYGHLALATVYDELLKPEPAATEYAAARKLLAAIYAQQPNSEAFALALADCCTQLARLTVERDRNRARELLREAERVLEGNGAAHEAPFQANLLTTKLDLAILPGFAEAAGSLTSATKIMKGFGGIVSTKPRQFYQLVCQLANRTPHLALTDSQTDEALNPPITAGSSESR